MKRPIRLISSFLLSAVLTSACLPYGYDPFARSPKPSTSPTASAQDPRFYEFIFESDEEPAVLEYSPALAFLPAQDPEFWLTAVATVPDETIQLLAEGAATDTLLPGIYPHLYAYVPQECQFTTIDPEFADMALAPDKSSIPDDFGPMDIEALAMSEDCHLLVFTALGHS